MAIASVGVSKDLPFILTLCSDCFLTFLSGGSHFGRGLTKWKGPPNHIPVQWRPTVTGKNVKLPWFSRGVVYFCNNQVPDISIIILSNWFILKNKGNNLNTHFYCARKFSWVKNFITQTYTQWVLFLDKPWSPFSGLRLNKAQPAPYPHFLLLMPELFVINGRRRQLCYQSPSFLNPGAELLISFPKLVHQDLCSLQAGVTLWIEQTNGFVLLY